METVGFIGLGNMGGPVAGHIQRAGFPMVVYDLREEATRPFEEHGAKSVDSAVDVARLSDVIITALPMPADVRARRLRREWNSGRYKAGIDLYRYLHQPAFAHPPARAAFSRQRRLRPRRSSRLRPAGRRPRHS